MRTREYGGLRAGFTLVELLVVLAIIAAVGGMVVSVNSKTNNAAQIEMAGEQVCAMLRKARALAIADQAPYSVVFNIQNKPGTTGIVINNWGGDHYCQILRYAPGAYLNNSSNGTMAPPFPMVGATTVALANDPHLPWPWNDSVGAGKAGNFDQWPTFAHVVEEIKGCRVGDPLFLPARQVRFLALGDADEGPRLRHRTATSGYGYGTHYPRPWFGWYDDVNKKLHPWGGYDPSLPAVAGLAAGWPAFSDYSGLCYQAASEGAITDSRHPGTTNRTYQVDWNGDTDYVDTDPIRGSEASWTLWRAGEPRPLVNAAWADFAIVFEPDGRATFPAMKCSRKFYRSDNGFNATISGFAAAVQNLHGGCGAMDLAKRWSSFTANTTMATDTTWTAPTSESVHYDRHTGRAHITLAPDTRQDSNSYATAAEALRSMWPMVRVYVTNSGHCGITKVTWDEGILDRLASEGRQPWPTSASSFAMGTAADRTLIEQQYRFGWLHTAYSSANMDTMRDLTPIGMPISDTVSTSMMIRRQWWVTP
jgi:prepilin-type N-terminal cleavage/methylation domain-containing protein